MITPLEEEITKIKIEFYTSQPKKMFIKKAQKEECSEYVIQKISLEQLLQNTMYVIKNTNYIFIDYPLFKQYISVTYYDKFIQHMSQTIRNVIMEYGTYEMHINLLSFSVSAVEKYYVIIQTFYEMCNQHENMFLTQLSCIHIYNTPMMIHVIKAMLSKLNVESIRGKAIFYTKEESPELLSKLVGL
jgi:hypothetical protein